MGTKWVQSSRQLWQLTHPTRSGCRQLRAQELATLGIGVAVLTLVSAGVDYTGWRARKAKRPRAGK
jgi:hypothetical protein